MTAPRENALMSAAYYDPRPEYWDVPLMRNEQVIERPVDHRTLTKRYTEEARRFTLVNSPLRNDVNRIVKEKLTEAGKAWQAKEAEYQAKLAENCWRPVKLPGFATVVRTDADARRCAHDGDAAVHG